MAAWAKHKIFWKSVLTTVGGTLTATTTESSGDFDVDYLADSLEWSKWKAANTTVPVYITFDAGASASFDYLTIGGHNLNTIGATIDLEYSATGAWAGEEASAFVAVAPTSDGNYLIEFGSIDARYTRLKITGTLSAAPSIAMMQWGDKTILDYASTTFDPHNETNKANINIGKTGMVLGIHHQYKEKKVSLKIEDADGTVYTSIADLWATHELKNFFWAFDTANNPTVIFIMRLEPTFSNPFNNTGIYRNITLPMIGRVA